jgi:membrane protease YdiL (CAAX protease family)
MDWLQTENVPILVSLVASLAVWVWMGDAARRNRAAGIAVNAETQWQRFGMEDGLLLLCLVFLAPLGMIVLFGGGRDADGGLSLWRVGVVSLAQAVTVVCVAWVFRPRRRRDDTDSGETLADPEPVRSRRRDMIGLAVALGWAGLAPCFLVNGLVIAAGYKAPDESHPLLKMLAESAGNEFPVLLVVCLAAGVCAPVVEEIQFRYVLQGWLSSVWGSHAGLWGAAVLFAAAHYSPGRPDAIPLFPFALILGWLYSRHRSLFANIVCHATFNLLNIAIAVGQNGLRSAG